VSEQVGVERQEDVVSVRIRRADRRNVLSIDLMEELTRIALSLQQDADVRAVVLAADGPNFSAGVDLKDPRRWNLDDASLGVRRAMPYVGERMCQAWEDIPAVTFCAIEGHCVGGGAALAIAADFRVLGASAYMHFPEVVIGLPLSWGALPRLVRLLGPAKAKRVVVLGEKLCGAEAVAFGIAEYIAEDGSSYARALDLATRVAGLPQDAVRMGKEAINVTSNALNRLASFMARDQVALAAGSREAVEARARFAKRRNDGTA